MDPHSSWVGFGLKSGGTLFLIGYESVTGALFNLGGHGARSAYSFDFQAGRLGAGLGGGGGLAAVFLFNAKNPRILNGKYNWDWGFNLSLGGRWDDVVDAARWGKMVRSLSTISRHARSLKPEHIEAAKNLGSAIAGSSGALAGTPWFTCIDVPLAGAGLEVSLHAIHGKLTVT